MRDIDSWNFHSSDHGFPNCKSQYFTSGSASTLHPPPYWVPYHQNKTVREVKSNRFLRPGFFPLIQNTMCRFVCVCVCRMITRVSALESPDQGGPCRYLKNMYPTRRKLSRSSRSQTLHQNVTLAQNQNKVLTRAPNPIEQRFHGNAQSS